jgi:hypothetical protein
MASVKARTKKLFGNADKVLSRTATAVAVAAGAGLVGGTPQAHAQIVYSGPVNIPIPADIDGVYLNILNGLTGTSDTSVPGWDINPYSASGPTSFNLWGWSASTWFRPLPSGPYPQAPGTLVDGTGNFSRPGGGTNIAPQVTLNAANYFGFRFQNEDTSTINYAWVEITFGPTSDVRSITGYAYESSGAGIEIAAVPEPSSMALLSAGAAGLLAYRRRRNAAATPAA